MVLNYRSWFTDTLGLLQKLTPGRIINYTKILVSYRLSLIFRRVILWGGPFSISFETTAICNLSCPECATGTGKTLRNRKLSNPALVNEKLHLHNKHAFYCNLYFQGEPFLHPNIYDIIHDASQQNFYTVISTNGHFLDESHCHKIIESRLSRLIISLDGIDADAYAQYRRGGNFDKVVAGIARLSALKKKLKKSHPFLVVQFLVNKTNEHQLNEAGNYVADLGADMLEFKSMQIYSDQGQDLFTPKDKKYNRYLKPAKDEYDGRKCFRLWSHIVYTSDGELVPCCYDKTPQHAMSASEKTFADGWNSAPYNAFRSRVLKSGNAPDICRNCMP